MKQKSLILLITLLTSIQVFSDTIYCCQADTLKLAYYFEDSLYNESCDINIDDVLIISSTEKIYISIEPATSNFNFYLQRKLHDICEFGFYPFEENLIEINYDGYYFGFNYDHFYHTNFTVLKGDSTDLNNAVTLPMQAASPSYEIKIKDDFISYTWPWGIDTNVFIVEEPGSYIFKATNHCNELFTATYHFDSAAFINNLFYAGKTAGDDIHYVDLDPDSTAFFSHGGPQGNKHILLDLNDDESVDMDFYISFYSALGGSGYELSVEPQNGSFVAIVGSNKNAALLQHGQIINKYISFSNQSPIYLYNSYGGMYEYGCISGLWNESDNYLGFCIPTTSDTLYGWIHISFSADWTVLDLIIDDYAYFSTSSNGITQNVADQFNVYPNPFTNELDINTELQNYSIELMNITGNIVYRELEANENEILDLLNLPEGIYLLKLISGKHQITQKVIKQ